MTRSGSTRLRTAAFISVAALVAGTLSASSGGSEPAAETTTLSFLSSFTTGNATGDEFNKLAAQFTAETGIKIDVEEANTNDIADRFEATALAGEERDMVILNLTPSTTDWLPQGLVVDTRKYLDDWGLTPKIKPEAIKYWTQEQGVAGFPFIGFNWPIWYNMDLLKKAGVDKVPATTDDLIAAATKLRAAGIQPMSLGGADWPVQNFVTWMTQQYVKPADAEKLFKSGGYCANPNAVKGLDLLGKLRDAGVFIDNVQGYTADQMTTAYFQGQAAMMPSGSWAYTTASPAIAGATQLGGFPVPSGGAYTKPTAFQGYSAGFFLTKNGEKHIDGVKKFMDFFYSQKVLQSWVSDASQILNVTPTALGDAQATNPLTIKGNKVNADVVDFLLLPDSYIPAGFDYQPVATEFLGTKGMPGAEFCKALDKLYA
jgi:multiple sugar transport system substrate-binding protein